MSTRIAAQFVPQSGTPPATFRSLPLAARAYIAFVVCAGLTSLVWVTWDLRIARLGLFIELVALAAMTSTVKVSLPLSRSRSTMSLSFAINLVTLLVLGTGEAVITGMLSAWTQCSFRLKARSPHYKTLFSIASVGLSLHATGIVYDLVRLDSTDFLMGIVRPLGPATTVYFFINSFLVAGAVGVSTRQSARKVWVNSFLWSAPSYFVAAAAAAGAAAVASEGTMWWGLLIAVPLYITYRSYRAFIAQLEDKGLQVRKLSNLHQLTTEALALAIEVKDGTSQAQVRRMQVYAEGLAKAMGMPEDEIDGVKTAALLHDIGHLAVPGHVLSKPGPLTYDEFERVKIHPRVGADILAPVPFPYPVARLILCHHERWNGSGYPSGLAGTDIPLGARVLAVADTFTSLLFDRPYRRARSYSEAVATLRENAGVLLDPVAVESFIQVLPTLEIQCQQEADGLALAAPDPAVNLAPTALKDIAGAHKEAKVLYEIAQALGTSLGVDETVRLISAKLKGLLPFSTCALFLFDESRVQFACRVAKGGARREVLALRGPTLESLGEQVPRDLATSAPVLRSVLFTPLVVGTHTLGAFALYDAAAGVYDHEHRRVLELIGRQAAPVIQNALVFEATQEASLTDALTGLPNRRALQQHLSKELARAVRQHAKMTVLLMDMDGLKAFNDQFGHHTGDRALREVASVIRSLLRPYDLCARFAGDEFVVALWDCDAVQADTRRCELQDAVAATSLDVGCGKHLSLAISGGAATFPEDGTTVDDLLAVADQRMYQQKRSKGTTVIVPIQEVGAVLRVAG